MTTITDSGLETWLIFHHGIDLPHFAAYPLVATTDGRRLLDEWFDRHAAIAADTGCGLRLEAPTWRANPDWAAQLGDDLAQLGRAIDDSVAFVAAVRDRWRARLAPGAQILLSGTIGPRGDGYRIDTAMTVDEAAEYHAFQARRSAAAGADALSVMTMGYVEEAAGVALAARDAGLPILVSFTLETDGRLPSGMPLDEAIDATDAATGSYAAAYMVNCAHPVHITSAIEGARARGSRTVERIGAVRANASALSHAELDEMTELDDGDPDDLAARYLGLRELLPALELIGGCCGTDDRHVRAIAEAWTRAPAPATAPR